jgi:hypothetical protein
LCFGARLIASNVPMEPKNVHCRPIYGADKQALPIGFSQIKHRVRIVVWLKPGLRICYPLAEANGNEWNT